MDNAHDGTVTLRRHNHLVDHHHGLSLSAGVERPDVQIHLIAVEVGVVGTSYRQVEPKGRVVEHLDVVGHDRHLVERGLAVEEDDVAIGEVPLDDIAHVEHDVSRAHVLEIDHLVCVAPADDVLGARVLVGAPLDGLFELLHVKSGDALGNGKISSYRSRNAHLVHPQVWISRDNGSGGKIAPLAHEIAPHPALFSDDPLPERLEGLSAPLGRLRLVGYFVVHKRGDVELEQLFAVALNRVGFTLPVRILERQVRLYDVRNFVREIVVASLRGVHLH